MEIPGKGLSFFYLKSAKNILVKNCKNLLNIILTKNCLVVFVINSIMASGLRFRFLGSVFFRVN